MRFRISDFLLEFWLRVKFSTAILQDDDEFEDVFPYIMGGTAATIQNFPFVASLRTLRKFYIFIHTSGSIIQ